MAKIVGFQPGHDVSYCILENGIPIIHEELERFTREKESLGDGLEMFFKQNPNFSDVKYFCQGNPSGRGGKWKSKCGKPEYFEKMQNIINKNNGEYYVIGHHQSHAAGAFYSSNFQDALIITLDAGGTDKIDVNDYNESTDETKIDTAFTIWKGKNTKIERICILGIHEFSIGFLWNKVTDRIFELSTGFPEGNQAGTVMAMGTIGNPDKYFDVFYEEFVGEPEIDWKFYNELAKKDEHAAFDIAAGLQKTTEVRFKEIMTPIMEKFNPKNLCFSGGVSLNSVMLGKMYDWFPMVKNIHCDPVPYDGGCSLGSARYVWHHILGNPRVKVPWEDNSSPYLGRTYSLDDINMDIIKFQHRKC